MILLIFNVYLNINILIVKRGGEYNLETWIMKKLLITGLKGGKGATTRTWYMSADCHEVQRHLKDIRAFNQHCGFHQIYLSQQLMKAIVLAESSDISILSSLSMLHKVCRHHSFLPYLSHFLVVSPLRFFFFLQ